MIKLDGTSNWSKNNLSLIGEYLKLHLMENNRVSVQPIRLSLIQKPVRRASDQPMGGTPAQVPKLSPAVKVTNKIKVPKKNQPAQKPVAPPLLQPAIPPPIGQQVPQPVQQPPPPPGGQQPAQRILVGFPSLPPGVPVYPIFDWRMEDRNLGSPSERRRRHLMRKTNLPKVL